MLPERFANDLRDPNVLAAALARALGAAGVTRTRIPHELAHDAPAGGGGPQLCAVCSVVSREALAARAVYAAHGVGAAARFVGLSFCGRAYSAETLVRAVAAQLVTPGGDGIEVEVMVHPGGEPASAACAQWDSFDASSARQDELETLCSAALRERLQALGQLDTVRPAAGPAVTG